jgi:type IV pilus assembly protein PilM
LNSLDLTGTDPETGPTNRPAWHSTGVWAPIEPDRSETAMAKIQAVWALDVGQAALKALKLVPGETPDQVLAEAFDFIEYPKILSQPDADPEQLVREALETFLERNDLKGCKVAIAVPGQAGLVKFIKLPPVEKKRIPDIVKFEARQQIPFALEEVVWAYQQIGDDDDEGGDEDFTMAEVGLFAMKRDQINRAILPFRVAGIEVDIVQMGPIALYNFITFDKLKGSNSKESVVLLDIGADNTDLIITDGNRIWQRNINIGGNHFTRALTKELKLTFAKAEHLKRNATKAPDPRSIFTAMRGVFNDFASEVNRSIGFYSSVNRTAKISKVIGLGNGFKLPGLQKFLQQNLSHEVDKLDGFARMVGDEVTGQPVFQDNMPSFAVAYGLAVQGLGKSGLKTNLLPPEIEQVRLIRAKKPWALAASALLMLGFAFLFGLGDYRLLAKVNTPGFKTAAEDADRASKNGADYKSAFEGAKGEWKTKFDEGNSLIGNAAERGLWPDFLKTLNANLPDPVKEYKLDPNKPMDRPMLDRLTVHVDAIKPVWRTDVATSWFSDTAILKDEFKNLMHPYDRATAPAGEGWIIQVVGHHYNPYPGAEQAKLAENSPKRYEFGPYGYLVTKILPALSTPKFRLYGVKNVALAWMLSDKEWTSEKGASTNGLASNTVPLLDRAIAPAAESGAGGDAASMASGMAMAKGGGSSADGYRGIMGPSSGGPMSGGMMGGKMLGGGRMGSGMESMYGGGMNPMADAASKKNVTMLTRTDFLIQFIWQPLKAEEKPKNDEELQAKLADIVKLLADADKNQAGGSAVKEADIEKASKQQSDMVDTALQKATTAAQKSVVPAPAGAGAAVAPAPGAVPAPSAAPPAAAPK